MARSRARRIRSGARGLRAPPRPCQPRAPPSEASIETGASANAGWRAGRSRRPTADSAWTGSHGGARGRCAFAGRATRPPTRICLRRDVPPWLRRSACAAADRRVVPALQRREGQTSPGLPWGGEPVGWRLQRPSTCPYLFMVRRRPLLVCPGERNPLDGAGAAGSEGAGGRVRRLLRCGGMPGPPPSRLGAVGRRARQLEAGWLVRARDAPAGPARPPSAACGSHEVAAECGRCGITARVPRTGECGRRAGNGG